MNHKLVSLIIAGIGFCGSAKAQITGAGIQPKMNFSHHLNIQKNTPLKFARSAEGTLITPGIDAFLDYSLNDKWMVRTKLGYETKGFVSHSPVYSLTDRKRKFGYTSLDLSLNRSFGNKKIKPYAYGGLSLGYLVNKDVDSGNNPWFPDTFGEPSFTQYGESNFDNYAKWNLGFTSGAGISFEDKLWLEVEFNRDLISPLETETLRISNSVYSVNVGVNLLKFFQK